MYIYIRSMSEAQNKIYDKLTDASDNIVEHIVKLILYPNAQEVNHWKREIFSFLWKVDKLKGKNKYPSEKFIYNALSTHTDNLGVYLDVIQDEYSDTPQSISVETAERCVDEYMKWVASNLSVTGGLKSKEVYAKLDSIIESTFD